MKTSSKGKITSYRNVIIQDESGLDVIRVKRSFLSLSGLRSSKASTHRTPVRIAA